MKQFSKWILAIVAVAATSVASAGIQVEPYLGYMVSGTFDAGSVTEGTLSGMDLGARVAYTLPALVWFGLDYSMSMSNKYKPDSGSDGDYNATSLGLVVGADLPLVRVWAGYGFSATFADKESDTDYSGTTTKVGVGYGLIPLLSLNLEYIMGSYEENSTDLDTTAIMLGVSAPIGF